MSTHKAWYTRTHRWGQTNLTEWDAGHVDLDWWKAYWRATRIQGVIINAGGIVAYYPSSIPLQYRAEGLGSHDLFGELAAEARREGLTVLARMDANRATGEFYEAHPDWFVVDAAGEPVLSNGRYFSCVNSDYYKQYIPSVLEEIITRYQPDGFADNSWTGVPRSVICYCANCRARFKRDSGYALPAKADFGDPAYRAWIRWSYVCRTDNWDLFNQVTRHTGGADCLWIGMIHGTPVNTYSCGSLKAVTERSKIVLCDQQSREAEQGFEQNGVSGSLIHQLAGWDTVVAESMANYAKGKHMFRKASNPSAESQLWMIEGISGGISPWYHHIGATHEDKRQFANSPPVMQWHEANEAYLYNREPAASIGLVWSEDNTDFYGRQDAKERVALPWRGFVRAMIRARIPFVPVHADHIERDAGSLQVLILPDLAAMSDSQCEAVRRFAMQGGSLVFTGATATRDEWGEIREVSPLEAWTGIRYEHNLDGALESKDFNLEVHEAHNYLRIAEPEHPVMRKFEDTAILPFGGKLHRVTSSGSMQPIATYIPSFPMYPPEFSWMRTSHTATPALLAGQHAGGGRIVYLAADADRCYGRTHLPDLGDLLAGSVSWAAADSIPLQVSGPGYLDCKIYRQPGRRIVHIVNLSGANQTPGPLEEYLPVGPIRVSVRMDDCQAKTAQLRVAGTTHEVVLRGGWAHLELPEIVHHELIVLE
ncbi:alpha-amylase family protein [Paenibacillus sp. 1P07SE]|uniref:alpha-amylase family protein n=1 Tax=Paenibacillus sp. 1P07SE TaxID=3132209 RepID=UPI0039A5ECF7